MHSKTLNTTNRQQSAEGKPSAGPIRALAVMSVLPLMAPIWSSAVFAQDPEADAIAEIIVTARRREEALRDMATSISVFSGDDIGRSNLNDITEYFLKTPNVSITELEARDSNQIAMRGITNSGDGVPGTSFAFYVDEFNMQPFSNNPQLNDVAQIEVLRGPQGTYFGRNAAGGAINVTTNKPAAEFDANVGIGLSRFNTWDVEGMLNVPVSDRVFFRGSIRQHESDGYMININPNGGAAGERYLNGRLALRFVPSDRLTIDLTTIHVNNELDSRFVVPTHQIPPGETFIAGLGGLAITDGLDPYPLETRRFSEDSPSPANREFTVVFGRFEYVGDNFAITNVTGYGDATVHRGGRVQNGVVLDGGADQTGLDIIRTAETTDFDEFSTEMRLASVGDDRRFDWSVGGIYSEGNSDYHISTATGADVGQIILPIPPGITFINDRNNISDNSTWALFGEVDWHVNDKLTLTYGGRYNEDESSFEQTVAGNVSVPHNNGSYSKYISRFAATYDINDRFSWYGVASQGFKAGAAATNVGTGLDPVKPETLWNYEVGIRGNVLSGRGRFSLSAFTIDWRDLQVSTRVVSIQPGGTSIVTVGVQNAAQASASGVEFEFVAAPSDSTQFDIAIGLLDGEYDRFPDAALTGLPNSVDLSGEKILQAPELTASLGAQYNFDIGDASWFVRGEWSYVDDKLEDLLFYAPPADVPPLPDVGVDFYDVPSYDVFNVRAGFTKDRYTVSAYVENVGDENFYTGTYSGLFSSGIGVRVHHQNYGIRLRMDF